ncbi:nitronate monooxygenase [Streptomyces sp. CB01881]|uniref:NAD(P)H-dependent flavin oxidoreductase n=1 Tax=Streptomyces sp. CB01881 TaxID=2078691 RepID=UPI0011DFE253|nr:nitronate monooxygenase [Streptomyces sp. CB01881]TYC66456.1 nitronate monooxygenase [Streptomyces sp. CB01881]
MRRPLAQVLGVDVGLLQSGMGGVAGTELACAVSEAGAAGCAGGYKLAGDALSAVLGRLVAGTGRPVGVNLIPEVVGERELARQLAQVLDETPARIYVSLFGLPAGDAVTARAVAAGRHLVVQVGTVEDGVRAAGLGAVVVAQGTEAGGHLLGTMRRDALVAALRERLPGACLVAAGGIGSPAQAGRALAAGADGVLLGTAFVVAHESRAHGRFKEAVAAAGEDDTVISGVYEIGWPGRRHRVLATPVTRDPAQPKTFIGRTVVEGRPYLVPRFSSAVPTTATTGRIEEMALYCGRSCGAVDGPAAAGEVVAAFAPVLPGAGVPAPGSGPAGGERPGPGGGGGVPGGGGGERPGSGRQDGNGQRPGNGTGNAHQDRPGNGTGNAHQDRPGNGTGTGNENAHQDRPGNGTGNENEPGNGTETRTGRHVSR